MKQAAFDAYADSYDEHFTETAIGKMQRARVYALLNKFISAKKKILEINCGTGEDAIWFAKQGHEVTATDISEGMIRVGERKRLKSGLSNVRFYNKSFEQLDELSDKDFDLVFSNFGGLNCVSGMELEILSDTLSGLLSPNGLLFLVIMGRKCKWEQFYFKRKGNPVMAARRAGSEAVEALIEAKTVKTWYYSPAEIAEIFGSCFDMKGVKPVGLFVPPSYLNNYFNSRKKLLATLYLAERIFARFEFASDYADHYAIVLQKKQNTN